MFSLNQIKSNPSEFVYQKGNPDCWIERIGRSGGVRKINTGSSEFWLVTDWMDAFLTKPDGITECFRSVFEKAYNRGLGIFNNVRIDPVNRCIEPEFLAELPGGKTCSSTDLFIDADCGCTPGNGESSSSENDSPCRLPLFIEAKKYESFSAALSSELDSVVQLKAIAQFTKIMNNNLPNDLVDTINSLTKKPSGKPMRIAYLLVLLGLQDSIAELFDISDDDLKKFIMDVEDVDYSQSIADQLKKWKDLFASSIKINENHIFSKIGYQLFHRTASAVIYAMKNNRPDVVVAVHSYLEPDDADNHYMDYYNFLSLFGIKATQNNIDGPAVVSVTGRMGTEKLNPGRDRTINVYFAWISCCTPSGGFQCLPVSGNCSESDSTGSNFDKPYVAKKYGKAPAIPSDYVSDECTQRDKIAKALVKFLEDEADGKEADFRI